MSHKFRTLVAALAFLPFILYGQTTNRASDKAGSLLLDPSAIHITEHFDAPVVNTVELAVRSVGDLIDRKRAADAAEPIIDRLWKTSFLKFIPIVPGGYPQAMASPVVSDDDPFFTPEYLKVSGRILDREVAASEKRSLLLFGHEK